MKNNKYRYDEKTQNCYSVPSINLEKLSLKELIHKLIDIHKEYEIKQGRTILLGSHIKNSNNRLEMSSLENLDEKGQINKKIESFEREVRYLSKEIYILKRDYIPFQEDSLKKYKIKMKSRKIKNKNDPFMEAKYHKKKAKLNINLARIKQAQSEIEKLNQEIYNEQKTINR